MGQLHLVYPVKIINKDFISLDLRTFSTLNYNKYISHIFYDSRLIISM